MNDTQQAPGADALIDLLVRQEQMVDELGTLAEQQAGLIESARTDALLELLGRRQEVIDRFVASQEELARLTDEARHADDEPDERQRTMIRVLVERIGAGLESVMRCDESDQQTLESERDGTRDAIASVDAGRRARGAYMASTPAPSRFADEQG